MQIQAKTPEGFYFYTASAGYYSKKRDDLLIVAVPDGARAAGVFTTNRLKAAPVRVSEQLLAKQKTFGGLVVNAGNANAATGKKGEEDALRLAEFAREKTQAEYSFLIASTGVIGVYLDVERIEQAIEEALSNPAVGLEQAAAAIMTTDKFPKYAVREGTGYTIAGITKGAGMISPSMATTLTFVFTDADFSEYLMSKAVNRACEKTFNRISVDGETSTNDSLICLSSRKKRVERNLYQEFELLLTDLLNELSLMILKDGEGATRILRIFTSGFRNDTEADLAARAVGRSLLVKTAAAGADPNWGRIFSAVGASGAVVDEFRLKIYIEDICVFAGRPLEYDEDILKNLMQSDSIDIKIDAGLGSGESFFYTCDLTEEYVRINSSYRT